MAGFLLAAGMVLVMSFSASSAALDGSGAPYFGGMVRGGLPEGAEEFVPGRLIVKYEDSVGARAESNVRREEGLVKVADLDIIDAEVVEVDGRIADAAVRELEARPDVEYAERDHVVESFDYRGDYEGEERFGELWGLNNTGQEILGGAGRADMDVDAPEAAAVAEGGSEDVVAVIDDGVDFDHPDLAGRAWVNTDEIPDNNIDDDGNGFIDDVNGYDFGNDDNTVHDELKDFHGTHVAGTIAASMNSTGVVGVAPNVKIMAVKFLEGPLGASDSAAIKAIEYASENGAKISNNSWGYIGTPSRPLKEAIEKSGMLFVASAGNAGFDNDTGVSFFGERIRPYPASFDSPNILTVAASDNRGRLAEFSNFGRRTVDISAPGVDVLSDVPSVEARSGMTLSTVGGGKGLVAGFGVEEIPGEESRDEFMDSAFAAMGHCESIPTSQICNTAGRTALLVDDDLSSVFASDAPGEEGPPDAGAVVADAIRSVDNVGLTVVEAGEGSGPDFDTLSRYDYVIWATGQAFFSGGPEEPDVKKTLTFEDHNALTRYMNEEGGKVFITGMDALFGNEDSTFVEDTLGLSVQSDYPTSGFEGGAGTFFEGQSHELSNPPFAVSFFHDIVEPEGANAASQGTVATPNGFVDYLSGTSMSAPHTAGVAALAASEFRGVEDRPAALKRLVMRTGKPAPATSGRTATSDLPDAERAVSESAPIIKLLSTRRPSADSPVIRASVVDLQNLVAKEDIIVRLDGSLRNNFAYNARSGVLSFQSPKLQKGRHFVRITAADPAGQTASRRFVITAQ